jgi:hypothetical protein
MSALGHKRTLERLYTMSALPPKADIDGARWNVRFVPIPDQVRGSKTGPIRSPGRREPAALPVS